LLHSFFTKFIYIYINNTHMKNIAHYIKTVPASIFSYSKGHKVISAIAVVIIATGGYYGYKALFSSAGETRYVLSRAAAGNLQTTIVGSGQVSASNQIDLKAEASGNIVRVYAHTGQVMKAGQIIAQIDSRDASLSLQSAQLSLQKLTQPVDANTLTQAQNSLEDAKQSAISAQVALAKSYEDGLTSVSGTFVDLPSIIAGMNDIFYTSSGFLSDSNISTLSNTAQAYRYNAGATFDSARNDYKQLQADYFAQQARANSTSTSESLIAQTYALSSKLSEALKNSALAVEYIRNNGNTQTSSQATTALNSINGWISKNNADYNNLISAKTNIENAKSDILARTRDVKAKTESLVKTTQGADPLDVRSEELSLQQKQLEYDKYNIRAPFDGILAKLDIKVGDSTSNTIGTFITEQKVAEITLNEVDIANIQVGQPVMLTFDAVDGVTATGTVASVDLVGTVSQGVVSYTTQIAFNIDDARIKPGMSVSATIITKDKPNVLLVPVNAVKTKNGQKYVEVVDISAVAAAQGSAASSTRSGRWNASSTASGAGFGSSTRNFEMGRTIGGTTGITLAISPVEQIVIVGDSNDTSTEIASGLAEGQFVVSKTIVNATSTKATTASAGSLFGGASRAGGGGGFGGGAARGR
jgi:HlyD family secretion protein